jgi:ubiquinone/menaquinone biosynthesis C-methylase UbiE
LQVFENLWLEAHGFSGTIISSGFIKLNKQYFLKDFVEFRDIYGIGIFLGKESEFDKSTKLIKDNTLKILFTNNYSKEKTALNKAAFSLSKKNILINPDSDFALRMCSDDKFIAYYDLKNSEYKFHLPASINRVVASCMSLLVPEKVSKVIDPCCGAGTLLIEHQKRHSFSDTYGVDKSRDAIHSAKANAKAQHCHIVFKEGDARRIPFLENSFDRIICNPPFNKRVKLGDKDIFYFSLLKQIKKVLKVSGVAIIYTVQKHSLKEAAKKERFILEKEIKLHLDKIQPSIFILRKIQ